MDTRIFSQRIEKNEHLKTQRAPLSSFHKTFKKNSKQNKPKQNKSKRKEGKANERKEKSFFRPPVCVSLGCFHHLEVDQDTLDPGRACRIVSVCAVCVCVWGCPATVLVSYIFVPQSDIYVCHNDCRHILSIVSVMILPFSPTDSTK